MFKWERKLIEQMDKWLPDIAWVLITLAALFMRRSGLWHVSFDYQNQFYPEAEGYLHSPFYTMLIWLLSFVPITPIRTVKLFISLFDFGVAAEGAVLLRQLRKEQTDKRALLACYTLLLVSPLTIENGLTWIHMDSLCMCFVLWAVLNCRKGKHWIAGILLGIAVAVQMQYGIFLLLPLLYSLYRKNSGFVYQTGLRITAAGCGIAAALTMIGSLWGHTGWKQSLYGLVNWLICSPGTGRGFDSLFSWLCAMLGYFAYPLGIGTVLVAFLYPRRKWPAAVVHVFLILYLGRILQYGYWY